MSLGMIENLAPAQGLEPRLTVLETAVLPLNETDMVTSPA